MALIAIDGSAIGTWSTGSTVSATLTSPGGADLICAFVSVMSSSGISVSGVTASGLTFTKRKAIAPFDIYSSGEFVSLELWTAHASAPLSSVSITASLGGSTPTLGAGIVVFGVKNFNTGTNFDPNGALPASVTSATAAAVPTVTGVSTSNANDIIIAAAATYGNPGNFPGTGFTIIGTSVGTNLTLDVQYQIVGVTQSSASVAFGSSENTGGDGFVMLVDAIQQSVSQSSSMFLHPVPFA